MRDTFSAVILSFTLCGCSGNGTVAPAGTVFADGETAAESGESVNSDVAAERDSTLPQDALTPVDTIGSADHPEGSAVCAAQHCDSFGTAAVAGSLKGKELAELSGLAASRVTPGVFFAHDDERSQFFALRSDASIAGKFLLKSVTAIDPEDIAVGPCGATTCVFLADIGDNDLKYKEHSIYRVTEPALPPKSTDEVTLSATRLRFYYPASDGTAQAFNAETLMVHPVTGVMYVVTKAKGKATVYRLPEAMNGTAPKPALKLAELTLPALATGGDIHPCSDRFLLRLYGSLLEYRAPAGAPFEAAFLAVPVAVPVASEPQGEAVAYLVDGSGFVTASDDKGVAEHPMHLSGCYRKE